MFGLARCFRPKATMSKNQRDTFSDRLGLGTVRPPQHSTAGGRYNTPRKTSHSCAQPTWALLSHNTHWRQRYKNWWLHSTNFGLLLAPRLTKRCLLAPQVCRGHTADDCSVRRHLLEPPQRAVGKHLRSNYYPDNENHYGIWRSLNIASAVSTSPRSRVRRRSAQRRLPAGLKAAVGSQNARRTLKEEEETAPCRS